MTLWKVWVSSSFYATRTIHIVDVWQIVINMHPTPHKISLNRCSFFITLLDSVNFKKNEKVYNPENSEVLKALQENDSEPEPGNEGGGEIEAADDEVRARLRDDDRYSHYYALACMLKLLNSGEGNENLFSNDKLVD